MIRQFISARMCREIGPTEWRVTVSQQASNYGMRAANRQPLLNSLAVFWEGGHAMHCECLDISFGGAFISLRPHDRLPHNSPVVVVFLSRHRGQQQVHQLKARVVRVCDRGAGLMFTDFKPDTFELIRDLLQAA
jgi:hypothetical protein